MMQKALCCKLKGQAEAAVDAPVVGIDAVTIRNTTVVRIAAPVTTAKHTKRASSRTHRISLR